MALEQARARQQEAPRRAPPRPTPARAEAMPGADYAANTQERIGNRAMLDAARDPGNVGAELRRGLGLQHVAQAAGSAPAKVDPASGATTTAADPKVLKRQREDDQVLGVITDLLGEYQSVGVKVGVNTQTDPDADPAIVSTDVDLKVPYRINGAGGREYSTGQRGYPNGRFPKGDDEAERTAMSEAKLGKAKPDEYQTAVQDVADKNAVDLQAQKGWVQDGEVTAKGKKALEDQLRATLRYTDRQGTQSQALGVDCSGFVYEAIRRVQRANKYEDAIWNDRDGRNNLGTATMLADKKNFKPVDEARDYRAGDLVLQKGHVEMVMGQTDLNRDEAVRYGLPTDAVQPWTPERKKGDKGPAPTPIAPEVRLMHVAESQPGRANFDKSTADRYGPDVDQYLVVRRADGEVQWYQQTGADAKDPSKRTWRAVSRSVRRANLGFPADPK